LWTQFKTGDICQFLTGEPDTVQEFQYNWTTIIRLQPLWPTISVSPAPAAPVPRAPSLNYRFSLQRLSLLQSLAPAEKENELTPLTDNTTAEFCAAIKEKRLKIQRAQLFPDQIARPWNLKVPDDVNLGGYMAWLVFFLN
jgi:hypothetical protein